jgi:HAD superfamily hydrolase (TIGR01549 family)
MYQNLIFDIDNTIFDYDKSNDIALDMTFNLIVENTSYKYEIIKQIYDREKTKFKAECGITASSHSKYIQLKILLNALNLDLNNLEYYFDKYNKAFKENITIYPFLKDFLIFCKQKHIKLYCLSNNTCREQIERMKETSLINFFENIYTSEEFGIEKPDSKLFTCILNKINSNVYNTAMIGDSYENDIFAANCINIYGFWFNKNNMKITKMYTEFNNYKTILDYFKEYHLLAESFEKLSKNVGERFDLVQAGGGNTSFKLKDYMFIKSSGCSLYDIAVNKNYVGVNYKNIKNNILCIDDKDKKLRESCAETIINNEITFFKNYKPSIETSMHTLTDIFTVHLHPIQFNLISGLPNCENILKKLFINYCYIDYFTPGIDVALEMVKKYKGESIIFLKNHGIVFTSDSIELLNENIENTILKLEEYLHLDFFKYKFVNILSNTMTNLFKKNFVSYFSEDILINNFINNNLICSELFHSFFPDKLVYCGNDFIFLINDNFEDEIINYLKKNKELPKIFIKKTNDSTNLLYISSSSFKKCLEIESVLKSHFICYNKENQLLLTDEILYLNNWDAEKYRNNLN